MPPCGYIPGCRKRRCGLQRYKRLSLRGCVEYSLWEPEYQEGTINGALQEKCSLLLVRCSLLLVRCSLLVVSRQVLAFSRQVFAFWTKCLLLFGACFCPVPVFSWKVPCPSNDLLSWECEARCLARRARRAQHDERDQQDCLNVLTVLDSNV